MLFSRYSTCVFFCICVLNGQVPRGGLLRGEVQGALPHGAEIELKPCAGGRTDAAAGVIGTTGAFELRGVESGCYLVRVFAPATGRSYYESIHEVGGSGSGGLSIRLKEQKLERPIEGKVSLQALRPKPGKKAMRAFESAQRLSAAGDVAGAAEKLREALRLHPPFAEAHINLGAQLARMGRHEEALAEFEHARLLGVEAAALFANAAASHIELKQYAEARVALRRSIELDEAYAPAHFLTGQVVLRTGGPVGEAEKSLRLAAGAVPASRLLLAQVLARTGRAAEARSQLVTYLESGHGAYRGAAERLLQALPK